MRFRKVLSVMVPELAEGGQLAFRIELGSVGMDLGRTMGGCQNGPSLATSLGAAGSFEALGALRLAYGVGGVDTAWLS